jgi:hypothetical protein
MKKIFLLIGAVIIGVLAIAQNNINQYEYWFDDDFAGRVITNTTPTPLLSLNTSVSAANLENGLHTFHIRFRDEQLNFSSVISQFFQKISLNSGIEKAIAGFEYWFDDDYAGKVYHMVSPQAIYQLETAINADQFANGLHTFHTRFIDTEGNWSPIVSQFFQKVSPDTPGEKAIAGFEYWFDDDYSGKVYQSISPQTVYQLETAINAGRLADGLHTFHMRFLDTSGNWSSITSQFFHKIRPGTGTPNAISSYRYWFDNDLSTTVNQTLNSPSNPSYLFTKLNLSHIAPGEHRIHFQFSDDRGLWSSVVTDTFMQLGQPRLDLVTPEIGGNIGDVTVRIAGVFFSPLKVRLEKQGELPIEVPDSLTSIIKGQEVVTTFDLEGRNTGAWNLVVEIVGDTTMVLENAFIIEEGILADPWTELVGLSVIRPNAWQNFNLKVGNASNINLYGVPVWIGIPVGMEVDFRFDPLIIDESLGEYVTMDNFEVLDSLDAEPIDSIRLYSFVVGLIPANSIIDVSFKIKSPTIGSDLIWTWATTPLYGSPFKPGWAACVWDLSFLIGSTIPGPIGCYFDLAKATFDPVITAATGNYSGDGREIFKDYVLSLGVTVIGCADFTPKKLARKVLLEAVNVADKWSTSKNIYESCSPIFTPNRKKSTNLQTINSFVGQTHQNVNLRSMQKTFEKYSVLYPIPEWKGAACISCRIYYS